MPRPGGWIKSIARMQRAAVVKAPQFARLEPLHQPESRLAGHRNKAPIGSIQQRHLCHRRIERPAQKVGHANLRHPAQRIQSNDRCQAAIVAVPVLVAELHGYFTQGLKQLRILQTQGVGDRKTIDENTFATLGIIHQAMQKLQPRLQLASRQIRVQWQVEGGVGVAVGVGFGLHIEQHAEVAFADERNPLRDELQRARLGGYAAHLGQADVAHGEQPLQQRGVVVHQRGVVEHRQLQIAVPQTGLRSAGQAFGAGFIVIGMCAQPARVEAAQVTVLPVDAQATIGVDARGQRLQILGGIDAFKDLLASDAVDALITWAIVAQPYVVKRTDTTVSPFDDNAIRQTLHATERADQRISTKIGNSDGGVHGGSLAVGDLPSGWQRDHAADVSGSGQVGLIRDDGLQAMQRIGAERRRARAGEVDVQKHLFIAGQLLLIADLVQAVVEVQALAVMADDLRAHFHLGVEFHFVQIIEVQFEGEQRVAAGLAVAAVHAEAVHQRVGGVAEDQQVEGVTQVAVVVDPVGDDGGLVGGEVGHGFGSNIDDDWTAVFASRLAPTMKCVYLWERACSRRGRKRFARSIR